MIPAHRLDLRRFVPLGASLLVLAACASTERSARHLLGPSLSERVPGEGLDTEEPRIQLPDPEPVAEEVVPQEEERPHIGDDIPRQIDLRGVPLSEALHLIASMAEVNIFLDAGLGDPVDASFPAVTLDDALTVLLDRNDLALVEDPPGIYWVTRADGSESESATFALQSVGAGDILPNLEALIGESSTLVADENQNFLMVRGPARDIDAVRQYLQRADRLKGQVLIDVEVLEVILDDHFEFGVQGLFSDSNFLGEAGISVNQDFSTSSDAFLGTIDLNDSPISLTINALESYGLVNVVSSPKVMAVTNTEATVKVVTEVPYIDTTSSITSQAGGVGTSSQQTVAFKEAGITMKVTPIIQAGGTVQLSIDQEFSEVVGQFIGIPILDTRNVTTSFLVDDSDTVVIGGLIQRRATEDENGVPILKDIPLLGRAFRSNTDGDRRRELLILITPRVLEPSQAAAYAESYRSTYTEHLRASGVTDEEN